METFASEFEKEQASLTPLFGGAALTGGDGGEGGDRSGPESLLRGES